MQEEHQEIRKSKKDGEPLNWDDYRKMEFTSNVRIYIYIASFYKESLWKINY